MDYLWINLSDSTDIIDSARTDINGYFSFFRENNGTYFLTAKTRKPWSGVNSTDAVKVKRHYTGSEYLTSSIRLHAADVNSSYCINSTDAIKITRRFVGSDTTFTRGNWLFEKPSGGDTITVSHNLNNTVVINGSDTKQNFRAICVGDVNGTDIPTTGKKQFKVAISYYDSLQLNSSEYFDLPLKATNDMTISALSLILVFPQDLIQIESVRFSGNPVKSIADNDNCHFFYKSRGRVKDWMV